MLLPATLFIEHDIAFRRKQLITAVPSWPPPSQPLHALLWCSLRLFSAMSHIFTSGIEPVLSTAFYTNITSAGLFGVITLQSWTYYTRFARDHLMLRLTVLSIWFMTLLKFLLGLQGSYLPTIKTWDNSAMIGQPSWCTVIILIFTTSIILLTHLFFVHKIWLLNRQFWIIPLVILITSVAEFAFGMAAYMLAILARQFHDFDLADELTRGAFGCALAVDWSITICLAFLMRDGPTGGRLIPRMINSITFYVVNTGLLISIADMVALVSIKVDNNPYTLYSISLYKVIGNLYASSLLAYLNSRPLHISLSDNLEQSEIHSTNLHIPRAPSPDSTLPKPDRYSRIYQAC